MPPWLVVVVKDEEDNISAVVVSASFLLAEKLTMLSADQSPSDPGHIATKQATPVKC